MGKVIHPCKACVSTSQALCHWPCSCYPNHALGQTNDWMDEIYPCWTAALSLVNMVQQIRSGTYHPPNAGLHNPREK